MLEINLSRQIRPAVALVLSTWLATPALAQLLPPIPPIFGGDTTPPTVSITSPQSGDTVAGTITVTATASDNKSVQGVQFFLDGNFAADDTSAPWAVPWDTTSTANGSHTLTAVARDAAGNRTTSSPVTVAVSNGSTAPPPPESSARHEETDPAVSYGAGWTQSSPYDWFAWSGGSAVRSSVPGARATFRFSGDSVTWLGYRSLESGIANLYLDGQFLRELDLFGLSDESSTRVYSVRGLPVGGHTLAIEVTGRQNSAALGNAIVVDAFDVPAPVISHLQDSDSDVAYTGTWTHEDGWTTDTSKPWSGRSATYTGAAGAGATLRFHGTAIRWVGYRGPEGGIARVYVDSAFAGDVDTYFYTPKVQSTVFTRTGLSDADHTLRIEVTGNRNSAASDALVHLDAFDVTTPGTRVEEGAPSIVYSGSWTYGNRNRPWSEGSSNTSFDPGARATFTFTGRSVSWLGCAKVTTGIARVYLDGVFVREVDTYHPWPTEDYQHVLFNASGLAPGTHTLAIEATGRKNPAASSAYVVVDAFDVQP